MSRRHIQAMLLALAAVSTHALCESPTSNWVRTLSPELYYESYEEFTDSGDKFMRSNALMLALGFDASRRIDGQWAWDSRLRLAQGLADYKGAFQGGTYGSVTHPMNTPRYVLEARTQGSYSPDNQFRVGTGIGMRFLIDAGNKANEGSYTRISTYFYLPITLSYQFQTSIGTFRPTLTYSHLLAGLQYSYIGSGITNTQKSGHGIELSLPMAFSGNTRWAFTPYAKFWNIAKSEPYTTYTYLPYTQTSAVSTYYEPHNKTMELGITASFHF